MIPAPSSALLTQRSVAFDLSGGGDADDDDTDGIANEDGKGGDGLAGSTKKSVN